MTKIERVLRELSDLYNFNREIEAIRKANARKLGLVQQTDVSGSAEGQTGKSDKEPFFHIPPRNEE